MSPRAIVRHPEVLSGRWHLEGTETPIADIRRLEGQSHAEIRTRFAAIALTDAEIDAVMTFAFPVIRPVSVVVNPELITVNCICGEHSHTVALDDSGTARCVCGRAWQVTARIAEIPHGPRAQSMDA